MTPTTVFLVAMESEITGIFDLTDFSQKHSHGFTTYKHTHKPVIIIQTGIGKSNAAAAAQMVLQSYPNATFINTGVVGAFNRDLELAEVVSVHGCTFFDVDVTVFGYNPGQLPGSKFTTYLLGQHREAAKTKAVSLVSGDTFLNNDVKRQEVITVFKPDLIDMELTSIAHVFHLHDKLDALSSIKAVSDYADGEGASQYEKTLPLATKNLRSFINEIL